MRADKSAAPSLSVFCRSPTGLVFALVVLAVGGTALSGHGGSGAVPPPPAVSAALPRAAPSSVAPARLGKGGGVGGGVLGKGGGAAQAATKHGADGVEAWGKARSSHRRCVHTARGGGGGGGRGG